MQKLRIFALSALAVWIIQVVFFAPQTVAEGEEKAKAAEAKIDAAAPEKPKLPQVTENSPQAKQLLDSARDKLFAHDTIQANIVERISFGDRRFEATGSYIAHQPPNKIPLTRLRYSIRVGDTTGELLEVCDGLVLRSMKTIARVESAAKKSEKEAAATKADASTKSSGKSKSTKPKEDILLTRRDISQIIKSIGNSESSEAIQVADLGLGGIPSILASLNRTFWFVEVTDDKWKGKPVKSLEGYLNIERIRGVFKTGLASKAKELEPLVPERARLQLDAETLFPVRIIYLRQLDAAGTKFMTQMTMEFTDVILDRPLESTEIFTLNAPPGVNERDETTEYENYLKAPTR